MARILSLDLIRKVEQTLQETKSVLDTARRTGVSRGSVYNISRKALGGNGQEQPEKVQGSEVHSFYLALKRSYENYLMEVMGTIPLIGFELKALYSHRAGNLEFLIDADGAEPEFVKQTIQDNVMRCMALLGIEYDVDIQYTKKRVTMFPANVQGKAFLEAYKIVLGRELTE
ncbi:TPA: hypothetical protein HA234_01175 [Candidatus Woesearchaeota archaeon]|nr:hypothetical protein [Candidatus Woesearchaeota archaeon]HIG92790.1 hypothetical protein [Candidatus Woesearchaeota archaeon]